MSISPISTGSNPLDSNPHSIQNSRMQQLRQEFQQLGQDLQSGNLSSAQSDFAALQQLRPQPSPNASPQAGGPLSQQFGQLSQTLQSSSGSTTPQDFTNILQDLQGLTALFHHHPHHATGASHANQSGAAGQIGQLLGQLGQALQSGNLSASQQAYTTLQQDLLQFLPGNVSLPSASSSATAGVSVNA